MKQLSALGVRRSFFQQQQHHNHNHHQHPARRMRMESGSGSGVGGVSSLEAAAFGPDNLPSEMMAGLLHVPSLPPPPPLLPPAGYQAGLFCVEAQRVSVCACLPIFFQTGIQMLSIFCLLKIRSFLRELPPKSWSFFPSRNVTHNWKDFLAEVVNRRFKGARLFHVTLMWHWHRPYHCHKSH